ncbi:helix-turn-helix domain-containing protein [bacterium]|nr:helix-turn-helix domain-containing protein [bacterium]
MTTNDHTTRLFGENLRAARKRAALSQQALADRSGIDRATISLIENNHENPRSDTILRLAKVLRVSPSELWSDPENADKRGGGVEGDVVQKAAERRYEPIREGHLHPGLEELLADDRTRLMLNLTAEEEAMLRSIRTRRDAPLGREFFLDVLISYRRHHS